MKIALVGYARSGKDTVGNMLRAFHDSYVIRGAFGDQMKLSFHETFQHVPMLPKPRKEYEQYAQSMRDIDEDVWVKAMDREFNRFSKDANWVITDLRQQNEERWCRENGFTIVRVDTPTVVRRLRSVGDSSFEAINNSERQIHAIRHDYIIYNNVTHEQLEKQVKQLLKELS